MRGSCLLQKKTGFTYEYFHGPSVDGGAHTTSLADQDSDMNGVVSNITYGDLWAGAKDAKKGAKEMHGPPQWLMTAYEGLAHFH